MTIPDALERRRALDPRGSFLVQAPAGSGKTELLIQRYLTLLAHVEEPEAVVAITFTKKAAGEMRVRVVNALRDAAGPRPVEAHEVLTWELARSVRERSEARSWNLFRNPGRMRICTIDSLCASLTRQMPWLSRLGGPPNVVEDAARLYAEAAERTIELVEQDRWQPEVETLLAHLDNNFQVVQGLVADMLARRDQWLRHVAGTADPERLRAELEAALGRAVDAGIERARAQLPSALAREIALLAAAAGDNLAREGREGDAIACAGMTALPPAGDLRAWLGVADTLLTRGGTWRKTVTVANGFPASEKQLKQRCLAVLAALGGNEPARIALDELRGLPAGRFEESQWDVLRALTRLLPAAAAQLQVEFRQEGKADFTEIGMAAQRALGDPESPTDLALSLDCRIEHLLIDEFQDTSVSQYSLLEKLTAGWEAGDGRTVFAVGDPMQSIYRFREAEVGLFLKAGQEGLGGVRLDPLRLSANFRSDGNVVDWVNRVFPRVMPEEEDIATGAIRFHPSEAVHGRGAGTGVTVHAFLGREDEAEAARVVEVVQAARARGAKKIAILVRAKSHLARIIPGLRKAGLRFRAVEIDSLAGIPLIQDLAALTRAMLHPADRIAWLAVLRAPWCGLTLHDLHALAGEHPHAAVWDLMRDEARLEELDPDGRARLARVRRVFETAFRHRPASTRAWVEGAWMALGGPACATAGAGVEDARAFFDLLEGLEGEGTPDLERLREGLAKLFARPDGDADDSFQLMSVHKAKGLEFDAVLAPGLGRKARSDEARLMLWQERPRMGGCPDLLLAPIHATGQERDRIYDYLKRIDALKSEYESGRLLYVAATRAKSELHLFGHVETGEENGVAVLKPPARGSLLGHIWDSVNDVFREKLAAAVALPSQPGEAEERRRQVMQRLTPEWNLPAPVPPAAHVAAVSSDGVGSAAVSFHWAGDTLRHVGTVVHQMLRRIAEDGLASWTAGRLQRRRPAYRAALAALGVPSRELAEAVDHVERALAMTLADDRGKWILDGGQSAACEYGLCGAADGQVVTARVDRTFVDEHGTRWVIDYKTGTHEGAGKDAFLDNEQERYRAQMTRYCRLFAGLEDRPVRAALYFPLLNGWREVQPEAAAGGEEHV